MKHILKSGRIYKCLTNTNPLLEFNRNYMLFSPIEDVVWRGETKNIRCLFVITLNGGFNHHCYMGLKMEDKIVHLSIQDYIDLSASLKLEKIVFDKKRNKLAHNG